MRKHLLLIFILALILLESCESKKSYKYIEVINNESVLSGPGIKEKEPKIIKAVSDSAAYLEAYRYFCVSQKVNLEMKESIGKVYSTPLRFKLIDNDGNDITNLVFFEKQDSLKKNIKDIVFSMNNSIKESIGKNKKKEIETFKQTAKVDSSIIKKLEPFFNAKKDEFDPSGLVWHKPKSAPKYTNQNGIYCYFQSNDGIPSNLRLRLQYYADDWLFFKKVQFSIDGKAYEYIPMNTETDSGDSGHIWEWFDEAMGKSNTELLDALANAKSAKMKLIGSQYHDIKTITSTQIRDIKRTLDLYKAMGGEY